MEKQGVPMNQYPQSPDIAHAQQQPPTYHQDSNAQAQFQQGHMYQQPTGQQYTSSPPPQQGYASPPPQQHQGQFAPGADQKGLQPPQNPGMPPQQQSGTVYQTATPLMNLNRSPAPADCPACGQRSMTTTQFETGNTTQ
ncbi:uncharacterized protein N0V89_008411 [Didymosphaeria variabile]|uniref:LITAF domain-containing protein n=1 Tax=Didymosphaeria variabile TaxID=1932322 RepID=A0A9W9C8T2_9PLEO|nr:uncharacterized protein N0V89_008411 [Didymosphaeria variabile]KAJ4349793.1 hypothetical protein N0V89_008411 [Didymosphaeria variabile]